ncbi:MAG: hypothetical protein IKQ82_03705, partial [Lentisphaeria bacterium]|nr:hypothetical protein [Lentisphaeria bacterium]
MKKTKIILVVILGSVVLLACLGFLGYFGVKTLRRSHLRMEAREAFAAEEWKTAEKLLQAYVAQDPDSEEDVVRLAQVYRHFGNAEEEMRCWSRANVLNPLKPEYWDDYTASAMKARAFQHLYASLIYKVNSKADMSLKDRKLYIICAFITGRTKEAGQYYQRMLKASPEIFHRDDLGRLAESLVTYGENTSDALSTFLLRGIQSDDPFVRQESIMLSLASLRVSSDGDENSVQKEEELLKQMAELNRFVGIPLLVSFYFSRMQFDSVIELAEPYLADIDDLLVSVFYAESCVYSAQPEKLKPLIEHFRSLGRKYKMQVSYFEALYEFSQGDGTGDALAKYMQAVGTAAQTDLSNLINLQVALNGDNVEKVSIYLETIMKNPPFYNLRERARSAVRHYLGRKITENPALSDDPRMVRIAQLVSKSDEKDPFLMRIILADQYKRNVLTEQIVQGYLKDFPYDPYLLQIAAEFELFNGHPELCQAYTERFYEYGADEEERSTTFDFLHMLALELMGQVEEATKEFTALVENTEMNRGVLYRYFRFCIGHGRQAELDKMAERLESSKEPDLKALAPFFRAEALFLREKPEEALSLLETAKTDRPDFTLSAANRFNAHDKLDQALSRYLALVGKSSDQLLILSNIAEVYLAKEKKAEALSYAERAWETDRDDGLGMYIYAKMLAANGRYQDAERILRVPPRQIELPDMIRELWTDIMTHCVREDLEKGVYQRALDRSRHYLTLFPDDATFLDFKSRA